MKPIIVITLGGTDVDELIIDSCPSIEGEFGTIKEAKVWIRETADDTLESGRHPGRGSRHLICRIEEVLIPLPTVTVKGALTKQQWEG